jgi:DNA-binding beta-propeller fold protein YncE
VNDHDISIRKTLAAAAMIASLAIGAGTGHAKTVASNVYTLRVGSSPASLATSVLFDGQFIWATVQNPKGGVLLKINLTGSIVSSTDIAGSPIELAYDGANVWVTDYASSSVTIVNQGGNVLKTIRLPSSANPEGITFDGKYVWVANNGVGANSVSKFDARRQTLLATYSVGRNPDGVAFDGTSIWVTNSYSNNVWKINRETGAYIDGFATGVFPLSIVYDGANMWIGNGNGGGAGATDIDVGSLTKIRTADGVALGSYVTGYRVRGLVFDGSSIWVCNSEDDTVSRLQAANVTLLGTFATGKNPRAVAFDGTKIWIANSGENSLTVIGPATDSAALAGAAPMAVAQREVDPSSAIGPMVKLILDAN